jgi:hypothetical protein
MSTAASCRAARGGATARQMKRARKQARYRADRRMRSTFERSFFGSVSSLAMERA